MNEKSNKKRSKKYKKPKSSHKTKKSHKNSPKIVEIKSDTNVPSDKKELKRKHKSRSRSRSKSPIKHEDNRKREKIETHHHYHHHHHHYHHCDKDKKKRSRSKSSSTSRPSRRYQPKTDRIKIDKRKLLEIAKANLIKSTLELQSNETNFSSSSSLSSNIQTCTSQSNSKIDDFTSNFKSNSKTISELVEYCKKLAHNNDESIDKLDNDLNLIDSESSKIFHPFEVKETNDFKLLKAPTWQTNEIPNKETQTQELTSQFPVSSGTQHRIKEEPIIRTDCVKLETNINQNETLLLPANSLPNSINNNENLALKDTEQSVVNNEIELVNIATLVSKRLEAIKRINKDSNDFEAYQLLNKIDEKLRLWSNSKQTFGQFTGSTDIKLLTAQELEGQFVVWARKDALSKATPITESIGKRMLEKMGWKEGEGLGKNKEGPIIPLSLDIKTDRKGLVAQDESTKCSRLNDSCIMADGKHPVSVLMELCKQRRWKAPEFDIISESGPPHQRIFLMKCHVNNVDYKPNAGSLNKKAAKALAALTCLKALGIISS